MTYSSCKQQSSENVHRGSSVYNEEFQYQSMHGQTMYTVRKVYKSLNTNVSGL